MSLYDGEPSRAESYCTPVRGRAGTAEKKGSPIKLGDLKHTGMEYDVTGKHAYDIQNLLDSSEGEMLEWFGDKLIMKVEAPAKDHGAQWIIADYSVFLRGNGWTFGRSTHVPSLNRATIPDGYGYFRPGRPPLTLSQSTHAMAPKPMPQWILEGEWTALANQEYKGFRKIREILFTQVGSDGSQVEEAWLLCLPNTEGSETVNVQEVPPDQQLVVQPQNQQPDEQHVFLAILRREAGPWPEVAYYDLAPNGLFLPPLYSILSVQGPPGQPGAPVLSTNVLLEQAWYINLVNAPPAPVDQQV